MTTSSDAARDQLLAAGMAAYRHQCVRDGTDPEAELVEARLVFGLLPHRWAAARLIADRDPTGPPASMKAEAVRCSIWFVLVSEVTVASNDPMWGLFAQDPDERLRANIAACLHADPRLLAAWCDDPERIVREDVARNPATPVAALQRLADDRVGVRAAVASNLRAPIELLERLASDEERTVRAAARKALAARSDVDGRARWR